MKDTILLTGGTGFLGSRVARLLLAGRDCDLVVIVRGATQEEVERRVTRLWDSWPEEALKAGGRVSVLKGDICDPLLGLSRDDYSRLVGRVTHIIHSAAELDLDGPIESLRRTNVGGTANLLQLAHAAHLDHGLRRFAHVSTAYVAGGRTGEVFEEDLTDAHGFSNSYEQTKYEGERLVRSAMGALPTSIFRPGMVVGDSETGEIQTFNTIYVPLRLYLCGKLKLIPARPDMPLNLVPVDYVANAIERLTFEAEAVGQTFHLTVDRSFLPTAKEMLDLSRSWARDHLGVELPVARFVPFERLAALLEKKLLNIPSCLVTYFNERRSYRRDNLDRILGPYRPDWGAILPRLLEYATEKGFLRRTGRTVHEQVLVRLQSNRIPLRLHDLGADGRSHLRSSAEMCGEISAARRSLEVLGVRPKDRVALVGHNSSRFLSVDVAVGLIGAVSVPLYYTAPPAEIEAILRHTGAHILFVGSRELIPTLADIEMDMTLVSFCRDTPPVGPAADTTKQYPAVPGTKGARVFSWDTFLELAGNAAPSGGAAEPVRSHLAARVDLGDVATIRFTSGTTGEPTGVTFRHRQLAWLAETVAAVLPWRVRIRPGSYLSFLPMNHVVEGILGAYSPAFMPTPVDVYFLENIHSLATALPRVRPTVFFSVPRFYEKLWERFTGSWGGALYRAAGKGRVGRAVRPIVRKALLRAAGLDRCAQLIVGSAICSNRLLEGFKGLGIELHNAYGLTEAPLVTINRFGRNRVGTVGSALPETDLRLGADGEIYVRGPQVSAGSRPDVESSRGEWLATGDIGSIDSDGYLSIEGRRKDILVTSYGKNIQASKIEGMLRSIPGVLDAVVLGENRPAVCGLLWLDGQSPNEGALAALDRAVERINGHLSHPERLKRWAVLAEKPSIDNAELTGNLKLKRATVAARRAPVIELLYADMADRRRASEVCSKGLGIIHLGREVRQCA